MLGPKSSSPDRYYLEVDRLFDLASDPAWNYEDGLLAGFLAAQMAVRVHLRS